MPRFINLVVPPHVQCVFELYLKYRIEKESMPIIEEYAKGLGNIYEIRVSTYICETSRMAFFHTLAGVVLAFEFMEAAAGDSAVDTSNRFEAIAELSQ